MTYKEIIEINKINKYKVAELPQLPRLQDVPIAAGSDKAEIILNTLLNQSIRRGDGILISPVKDGYVNTLRSVIQKDLSIPIVFQGFAFKCHNPIETLRKEPDLGELATLQRLADINNLIKTIYSPGVHFTVLTEGKSYMHLFGATKEEVARYQKRVDELSNLIGIPGDLTLIDLMDLVKDKAEFFEECQNAENSITLKDVEAFTPVMMRSMPIIEKVAIDDLMVIFGFKKESAPSAFQAEFSEYLKIGATDLAIKYLAIQKIKSNKKIIQNNFPEHLYFSTTAKPDRYSFHPIHRKTRLYAHHGVPLLGSDKVDIVYFGEILTNPGNYTAVYLDGDTEDSPFYFLKGRQFIKK